jgi:hypothetical protein
VNLPFSKQFGDLYLHWNGGFTQLPKRRRAREAQSALRRAPRVSGIWRARRCSI